MIAGLAAVTKEWESKIDNSCGDGGEESRGMKKGEKWWSRGEERGRE